MSMKLTFRAGRRVLGGTALVCAAALLPGTAMASVATPARTGGVAWKIPHCRAGQTLTWLGLGLGGGTAGTIFYPLEFTNVSKHTCTLFGYPRVSAISKGGRQIGKSSRHLRARHRVVTLPPGWTAHASLGIIEAGNVCSRPVMATTLKIHAPHQRRATQLPFQFQACWHKGVLVVGPVQPGVGIP
ncbi:MAG TPA: DUF4232 domain-containing protein [Streptosporangiaceae bacterium]|nr:DUF4232 domain-containing protein [Streptosporangiaceae bacterium]